MTPRQFTTALAATHMPSDSLTAQAVRLVLVDGLSAYAAAQQMGMQRSAVSRALKRLEPHLHASHCPTCGHAL